MDYTPYEVKSREYLKNHFAERRTYNCDKNGELHIRVEPLDPTESIRPASPVSPVMPTPSRHGFENEDLRFSKFKNHSREGKNNSSSEMNLERLKIPRPKSSGGQKSSWNFTREEDQNYYECLECLNELHQGKSFDENNRDEAEYSRVIDESLLNTQSSRQYRQSDPNRRARTSSPQPQSQMDHYIKKQRSRSRNEFEHPSPIRVTSALDSGMSSAGSSFSPLSSVSSNSHPAQIGTIKKITRKSRFVSIHDGRPVSPFVTKVYYEPLYSDQLLSLQDRQYASEVKSETSKIIMNPLFMNDL